MRKMQSSSHELSSPIADSVYVKKYLRKNSFTYAEKDDSYGLRYPTDVRSAGFQSQVEAYRVSSHSEELWYNETVSLCVTIYNGNKSNGIWKKQDI